jgi:hypothetical protein
LLFELEALKHQQCSTPTTTFEKKRKKDNNNEEFDPGSG